MKPFLDMQRSSARAACAGPGHIGDLRGIGSRRAGFLGASIDIRDLAGNGAVEWIVAGLESLPVTDAVIKRFDLLQRYREFYLEHVGTRSAAGKSARHDEDRGA